MKYLVKTPVFITQPEQLMEFGKHQHLTLGDVFATKVSYVEWIINTIEETKGMDSSEPMLRAYLGIMKLQILKGRSYDQEETIEHDDLDMRSQSSAPSSINHNPWHQA